jgi:2-haloacid dehalogenase
VVGAAGLASAFDAVISVEAARQFKTAPAAYEQIFSALDVDRNEVLFVSSNGWDACGAKWFGYVSFWVNRARAPAERLGVAPDGEGRSLMAAADLYLQWAEAAAAR